jgi:hypothetical protein
MVARDAAIALDDRMVVGNAVTRDKEGLFVASKIGDEVTVTVPPAVSDAGEFSGSTVASDMTETDVGPEARKAFLQARRSDNQAEESRTF